MICLMRFEENKFRVLTTSGPGRGGGGVFLLDMLANVGTLPGFVRLFVCSVQSSCMRVK